MLVWVVGAAKSIQRWSSRASGSCCLTLLSGLSAAEKLLLAIQAPVWVSRTAAVPWGTLIGQLLLQGRPHPHASR